VLDGPVLARGVHRLEDQQQRPAVLGVELVLELGQELDAFLEDLLGGLCILGLETPGIAGVDVLQTEPASVADPERLHEATRAIFDLHGLPGMRS
jgi:hypothetical protein